MAVLRTANFTGQQRVDVPHLRAIEAAVMADFDVVAGRTQSGGKALVVRGLAIGAYSAGVPAISLQLAVADSVVYNLNASESGTCLWIPADRPVETLDSAANPRVSGGFVSSATNYVGLDYVRSADASTTDLVKFLDADTHLEAPLNIPLARTLDYRIVIGTTPFSAQSHLVPIAKVSTDASNLVVNVVDARTMLGRLGRGGDFPDAMSGFSWPQGRVEGAGTFSGGDKGLISQKDWQDAVMSRIWEIGGGESWYSPVADRNVKMIGAPGVVFGSTADNLEWVAGLYGVNHLHWQGLRFTFENAGTPGIYYNTVTDQLTDDATGSSATSKTALAIGDCLYVDLDRTSNATVVALRASLQTLGEPSVPGTRIIIAWRTADGVFRRDGTFAVNTSFSPATTVAVGAVRLANASGTPGTPTVFNLDSANRLTVGSGSYTIPGNDYAIKGIGGGIGRAIWGESTLGTGVYGASVGGDGVEGVSNTADGVHGSSVDGVGVNGTSANYYGVYGSSDNNVGVYATTGGIGVGTPGLLAFTHFAGQYSAYFYNEALGAGGTAARFKTEGTATSVEVEAGTGAAMLVQNNHAGLQTLTITNLNSAGKACQITGRVSVSSGSGAAALAVTSTGDGGSGITSTLTAAGTSGIAFQAWTTSVTATGTTALITQDGTGKGLEVTSQGGAAITASSTSGVTCHLTGNDTRSPLLLTPYGTDRVLTTLPSTPQDGEVCIYAKENLAGAFYLMAYSGELNTWYHIQMVAGIPA